MKCKMPYSASYKGVRLSVLGLTLLGFFNLSNPALSFARVLSSAHNANVVIDAKLDWQDTGVSIQAFETYKIQVVSGQWTRSVGGAPYTNGSGDGYICANYVPADQCVEAMPSVPGGALIAKIGNRLYEVGNSREITFSAGGSLYLRINDGYGNALSDNDGQLDISINRRVPALSSNINSIDPSPPYCVYRNAANLSERTLIIRGTGLAPTAGNVQFLNTVTNATSIMFDQEFVRKSDAEISVDIARINSLLWADPKIALKARMTQFVSGAYQPISDWSSSFILANDEASCGVARPTPIPTPTPRTLYAPVLIKDYPQPRECDAPGLDCGEPNDQAGQAYGPLQLGRSYYATVGGDNDAREFYHLNLQAGSTYEVMLNFDGFDNPPNADLDIVVRRNVAPNYEQVIFSSNQGLRFERFSFTAPSSGSYLFVIASAVPNVRTVYTLQVQKATLAD